MYNYYSWILGKVSVLNSCGEASVHWSQHWSSSGETIDDTPLYILLSVVIDSVLLIWFYNRVELWEGLRMRLKFRHMSGFLVICCLILVFVVWGKEITTRKHIRELFFFIIVVLKEEKNGCSGWVQGWATWPSGI